MGILFTSFNIGKDMVLSMNLHNLFGGAVAAAGAPAGDTITADDLGLLSDWDEDPQNSDKIIHPINNNGVSVARSIEQGCKFSFSIDRVDGAPDILGQLLRDAFYATGAGSTLVDITVVKFHSRGQASGTTTLLFPNSTLRHTKGGKYAGEEKVSASFEGYCPLPTMINDDATNPLATALDAQRAAAAALRVK